MPILQFHISLPESRPPIWRRIQLTDDYRLDRFHQVIQIAMGWENSHLHEFTFGQRRVGMVLEFDDGYPEPEDETKIYLRDLQLKPGGQLHYLYDFGDNWQHLITLESITEGALELPRCTEGTGHCPVEDIGGIDGHMEALEALADPDHPYRYHFWGDEPPEDFDPTFFPIEEVNAELAQFGNWHSKHPRAKSTPTPWHQI
jgi:hypothetical protein